MRLGTSRTTKEDSPPPSDKRQRTAPTKLPKSGIMGADKLAEWMRANAQYHGGLNAQRRVLTLQQGALREDAPSTQNAKLDALMDTAFGGYGACPINIVGCDPGKQTLAQVVDPYEHGLPPDERRQSNKVHTVRYTAARRRHDAQPGRYGLRRKQRLATKYEKRVKHASMAAEYKRQVVDKPDEIRAAEHSIVANAHAEGEVAPCANGPTTGRCRMPFRLPRRFGDEERGGTAQA